MYILSAVKDEIPVVDSLISQHRHVIRIYVVVFIGFLLNNRRWGVHRADVRIKDSCSLPWQFAAYLATCLVTAHLQAIILTLVFKHNYLLILSPFHPWGHWGIFALKLSAIIGLALLAIPVAALIKTMCSCCKKRQGQGYQDLDAQLEQHVQRYF